MQMKKALLIGINYTTLENKLQLKGCISDSYKMKELITIHYGFALCCWASDASRAAGCEVFVQ